MNDDKALLEAAARAAGYALEGWNTGEEPYSSGPGFITMSNRFWNPLTDDGDALRLAVALRLDMDFAPKATWLGTKKDAPVPLTFENHKDDPYAATRRAIVRAAASLGQEAKHG